MAKTRINNDHIRIREESDSDRQVVFHPENDDLFVRSGKQVIDACRLDIGLDLWLKEFGGVFAEVKKWSSERSEHLRSCYCSPGVGKVVFFFTPKSEAFDFELGDELAVLNHRLYTSFGIGAVELHQIPWKEIDRFLDEGKSRHVYGEIFGPHHTVET